ncbi:uncharacterized protein J3D65DRAFT_460650 [Phyllosticta citribraziliensis]|uniref:Uncharacterized protein n=1 Tax=Phyllosticta citribraziliensis TaxID=989973 RepID=A0ABR1LJF6_9PEZI
MLQPKMKDLEEMKAQYEAHGPAFDKPNQASDCANVSNSEQQAYVEEAKATIVSLENQLKEAKAIIVRRNRQLDAGERTSSRLGKQLDAEEATNYSLRKQLQNEKSTTISLKRQLQDEEATNISLGKRLKDVKAASISLEKQLQDEEPTTISLEEQLQDEEATDVSLGKQFQDENPTAMSLEEQLQDEEATKASLEKQLQDEKSPTDSLEKQVQDVASSDATRPQIERAPRPFCFNGNSIDWREFKLKMRSKMQLDGHLYPTANDRWMYVMSQLMTRLKADAFDEFCSFLKDGTISIPDKPHGDFEDLLQILENVFDPPPRSRTGDSSRRARGRGRNSHRRPYPSDVF